MNKSIISTEIFSQVYLNNCGILVASSEAMIQKFNEGNPLFFTISIEDFKKLYKKAIEKDSGYTFPNCKGMYIPNSYIELHVNKNLDIMTEFVSLQVRKRKDGRGINFFINESHLDFCSHKIEEQQDFEEKEFFNEILIKTQYLDSKWIFSIKPLE
ncbi:MAG: hypothetical protein AB8B69_16960 [Chitinophagales bacterium]